MMRASVVVVALLALLSGCVQSLHPYYSDDQLTYDQSLVGKWTDAEGKVKIAITGDAENKLYHIVYTDEEGKTGKFEVHVAKVGQQQIVDITPEEMPRADESDMYQAHLLPVHSFMLLERKDADTLLIRQMSYDWFKEHLDKHPDAIAHEKVDGDRYVLTAATAKLQAFVLEHVKTPGAYEEPAVMKRVAPPATAP